MRCMSGKFSEVYMEAFGRCQEGRTVGTIADRYIRTPSLTASQHHKFSRCGRQGHVGAPKYADRPQPLVNIYGD